MISVNQLKHKIRSISKEKNIPHEVLYQNFFFERFLERLSEVIKEICEIQLKDKVKFSITNIYNIRLEDKYDGLRYTILCEYSSIRYHIKLEFSAGDIIYTPLHFRVQFN